MPKTVTFKLSHSKLLLLKFLIRISYKDIKKIPKSFAPGAFQGLKIIPRMYFYFLHRLEKVSGPLGRQKIAKII